MASSGGSLDTANDSRPSAFSFSSQFATSFIDLLNGVGDDDDVEGPSRFPQATRGFTRGAGGGLAGGGVPKFKSVPPPSLPISPPPISPSSYFAIPAGLSPAELLDSPVLLPSSQVLPSPTTGSFPTQQFNWKMNSASFQRGHKEEDKGFSDFAFQTYPAQSSSSASIFRSSAGLKPTEEAFRGIQQQTWDHEGATTKSSEFSAPKPNVNAAPTTLKDNSSTEFSSVQRERRRLDDGYNWRKYGQKQVKGSENPRSYYKCTHPNCPTKKKVETDLEGVITEIVYKGTHNHPKPLSVRKNSSSQQVPAPAVGEASEHSSSGRVGSSTVDSAATPENSTVSLEEDELDVGSQRDRSAGDELHDDEPDAKRWRKEGENEGVTGYGNRAAVREPRVVVQTTSDIDILDDGYRWRKYGQKVVKGNTNPRSYYKCTSTGCPVRKHVERASHDLRSVITTYEGKHNHDVPAARGAGMGASRLATEGGNVTVAVRPSATAGLANQMTANSLFGERNPSDQAPFTLQMLQPSPASYGFPGFDSSTGSYGNREQYRDDVFPRAKDEPRDEMLLESVFC